MLPPMLGLRRRAVDESATDTDAATETLQTSDQTSPPTGARTRTLQVVAVLGTLALTLLWAWLATTVLDASNFSSPLTALRNRDFEAPAMPESVAVVWVLVLLVVALVGRLWVSLGIVTALTALIGAVNATKLELRNDPVYPSDVTFLSQPSFLFEMVPKSKLVLGAVGLVLVIVVAALVGWLVAKLIPSLGRTLPRRGLLGLRILRVVVVVVCLGLLHLANNFNEPGNPWREAFDGTGLRWRDWDQRVNYQRNGFVAGLLFNTHITAMAEPDGYSKAAVEKVAARYQAQAAAMNQGRTGSLDTTNVVTILSESFSNPSWLKTVKFASDPIPRTTALMKQTLSGKMLAPGYGSGTANVEFEVLTGQSKSQLKPQIATAYEQMVQHYKSFPSAVQWFIDHGHTPIAIHPFSPRMYARPEVYDALGFTQFITKDQMKFKARGGGRFIDDGSAFDEVLEQIKSHDKPLLAHLVSMQNHMPYGNQYDDPVTPTGLPGNFSRLAGQYGRGIARTDEEFAAFLAKLKKQPEPTAVVFYGDHLPPQVYPESLVKREGQRTTHETPFVIWSNGTPLKHQDLPTTSPIQFLPKLFDALNVPIPPWFALLDDLDQQIPAMDAGLYVDAQDKTVKESQLSAQAQQALSDYRLIMYDLSIGKRYSETIMYGDAG
jgi:phosphoglycerol transferase MdoB-like AlkP superfamily enzyme